MGKKRTTTDAGAEDDGEASEDQRGSLSVDRARAWSMYLRGMSRAAIARELGRSRRAVAGWIAADYADLERERVVKRERELLGAVARMRNIQQQAWADHDADDERERSVLALVLGEQSSSGGEQGEGHERERERAGGRVMARYQSQRSQYLRVILDAEREIARLCGLYEADVAVDGAIVFRLERVSQGDSRPSQREADDYVEVDGGADAGGE